MDKIDILLGCARLRRSTIGQGDYAKKKEGGMISEIFVRGLRWKRSAVFIDVSTCFERIILSNSSSIPEIVHNRFCMLKDFLCISKKLFEELKLSYYSIRVFTLYLI